MELVFGDAKGYERAHIEKTFHGKSANISSTSLGQNRRSRSKRQYRESGNRIG